MPRAYVVSMLLKNKPPYIAIEDPNIKGMLKNRHLSRSIANQGFYDFVLKRKRVGAKLGMELCQVARFYPSANCVPAVGTKK